MRHLPSQFGLLSIYQAFCRLPALPQVCVCACCRCRSANIDVPALSLVHAYLPRSTIRLRNPSSSTMASANGSMNSHASSAKGAVPNSQLPRLV